MLKAHAIPVPSDCVLAPLYVGADLLDAFAVHLPAGANDDLEVLARAGFERQAWWIRALTRVRDAMMATVGVKSSRAIGAAAAARGPVIGFFPLLSKSARGSAPSSARLVRAFVPAMPYTSQSLHNAALPNQAR